MAGAASAALTGAADRAKSAQESSAGPLQAVRERIWACRVSRCTISDRAASRVRQQGWSGGRGLRPAELLRDFVSHFKNYSNGKTTKIRYARNF